MVANGVGQITRSAIVTAALAIIDTYGLDRLNMRRLGEVLSVSATAVYYHFDNKEDVLQEVSAHLLEGMTMPDPAGVDCAEWLMDVARKYVAILFAHPNATPLLLSHRFRLRAKPVGELVLRALVLEGISPADGLTFLDGIEAYCLGVGMLAARPAEWLRPTPDEQEAVPYLTQAMETASRTLAEEFELGCRSLIVGLLSALGDANDRSANLP